MRLGALPPSGGNRPLSEILFVLFFTPERMEICSSQERMHGDGYLSSPERSPRPFPPYITPTTSYEDPYYGTQFPPRSGSVTPVVDDETRSAFYSMRVEQMERQLASLTGLVQKALSTGVPPPPRVDTVPPTPTSLTNSETPLSSPRPNATNQDFLQVPNSAKSSG
ncbi:Coiled-coil domain-containing protein [Armadillidium vulgare]|nr:Coiled-coil domain-containing protein [Armadillidium vulgare]